MGWMVELHGVETIDVVLLFEDRCVFWLVAKIFFRAAAGISADMEHYKEGAARLKSWIKKYITGLHIESLDFHKVLEELVVEVESVGSVLTQSLLAVMLQAVVTFIFLIYMLWSPVKVDGSAMATEARSGPQHRLSSMCRCIMDHGGLNKSGQAESKKARHNKEGSSPFLLPRELRALQAGDAEHLCALGGLQFD
ncbi:unnamed protein product [Durusdinium trenchii]|uniref:Uncharacterized protein n=1 Tax=Durusdinium trenchii TaxID=1381693 RepID=A0ABP0MWV5_9DINO